MKKIRIETISKTMLADIHTPVGIYLRLRDRFRDTILLESTDHHAAENSYSFICVNAIAGIEIKTKDQVEFKLPNEPAEKLPIGKDFNLAASLWNFMGRFEIVNPSDKQVKYAQGLFGYFGFDAVQFLESLQMPSSKDEAIPIARYRLYQYVIAINHFKDELILCENRISGLESEIESILTLINNKDVPVYPFKTKGAQTSSITDDAYQEMVKKGVASCLRGDVFQIVLSRRFSQAFSGDEFNVYRALRHVNPSPYLFFFDYGDYKLMGSSPESQLIINNEEAIVHPIAGTFQRTGDDETDRAKAEELEKDPKENAEHVMLVDLARNDLSTVCTEVKVSKYKEVKYYSHVIHLVSEVSGKVKSGANPFEVLFKTFPAGTLSGAPKVRAMQLIAEYEGAARGFYGGALGFIGFDGSCNHAIMIRTLLSMNNQLTLQAGAGVVAASNPESELNEVNHKLGALKKAIALAEEISNPSLTKIKR